MAIKRHRRGDRVYLAEYKSIRQGKKVISKFVRYLGPADGQRQTTGRRGRTLDRLAHGQSVQAGAVRLLWAVSEDLHFRTIIDGICGEGSAGDRTVGKLLTVWAINRVLDPESATKLEQWVRTTDLPSLTGVHPDAFTKDAFLRALDAVCRHEPAIGDVVDHTPELDQALYKHWRSFHPLKRGERETLAYDLTSVMFFGATCPLAVSGYNPARESRPQVKVAVVASKVDRAPILHMVYDGKRQERGTWRSLLVALADAKVPPGMLISDRGMMGKEFVRNARDMGWHVLGGVPKTAPIGVILSRVSVSETPDTLAMMSRSGSVYATKVRAKVLGEERRAVVYANAEKGVRDRGERNEALAKIGAVLDELAAKGGDWSESKLHSEIRGIVGPWSRYIKTSVRRKGSGPRVAWEYRRRELDMAVRQDGKFLLLCTDERVSACDAVRTYFSKDFVEKVFRTLKTDVEVEPVRHRLEHRVRAYLFVCMLAYRLAAALRYQLEEAGVEDDPAEHLETLLRGLARVEKIEVRFGNEVRTWYLNVTERLAEDLKTLGLSDMLEEETRLVLDL
jgi:hypothetical protein